MMESMEQTLNVSEIFHSIQGESSHAGRPCTFVRLAGCNLACAYCDTGYARQSDAGRVLPLPFILEAVRPYRSRLVEITGGEPLLQPATRELARLLSAEDRTVLVETNGSMDISVLPHPVIRIMDVKTPSSGMAAHNRLENFAHLRRGDEVKFVLSDRTDYEWAKAVIRGADFPAAIAVALFAPVAGRLEPAELAKWIVDDKLSVRLNLQLHKFIWPGIDRGV